MRFKKLYEDEEIEVYKAPTEEELEQLVLDAIREAGRPLSWKELRQIFSGVAGEDRLRKVLIRLIESDRLIELPDGTFAIPGMEENYVPKPTPKRVRPLVPSKFRQRWGNLAPKLRRSGLPLGEALKRFRAELIASGVRELEEEEENENEFEEFLEY
ncbi:MAG: hypothetical protein GXO32_07775 [Crenarchaeota archaeon]|nr:hypothetical protein [Thermoproteota archaeon]